MKIGPQADETLQEIIDRKTKEEAAFGYSFWGYGGNLIDPIRVVQPFAEKYAAKGQNVKVLFVTTKSLFKGNHIPRATKYSKDGVSWNAIPRGMKITVSKSALKIKNLHKCDFDLSLCDYRVALGPSAGRVLSNYFRLHTDKAVAYKEINSDMADEKVTISYAADLVEPYAVRLKH